MARRDVAPASKPLMDQCRLAWSSAEEGLAPYSQLRRSPSSDELFSLPDSDSCSGRQQERWERGEPELTESSVGQSSPNKPPTRGVTSMQRRGCLSGADESTKYRPFQSQHAPRASSGANTRDAMTIGGGKGLCTGNTPRVLWASGLGVRAGPSDGRCAGEFSSPGRQAGPPCTYQSVLVVDVMPSYTSSESGVPGGTGQATPVVELGGGGGMLNSVVDSPMVTASVILVVEVGGAVVVTGHADVNIMVEAGGGLVVNGASVAKGA